MSQLKDAALSDLRAITHALCEHDGIKAWTIHHLRAVRNYARNESCNLTDHGALIEQATARELCALQTMNCKNEHIDKIITNYLQVLRHKKPTEVAPKANPIKDAIPKELHNAMLALCEDNDAKERVVSHLRVLRRSEADGTADGAAVCEPDSAALMSSATATEMYAIGLVMSDADENIKKRLLEALRVLSIFGELQGKS